LLVGDNYIDQHHVGGNPYGGLRYFRYRSGGL
jgi:hypothetical protein